MDVFQIFSCFFEIQGMLAIWSSAIPKAHIFRNELNFRLVRVKRTPPPSQKIKLKCPYLWSRAKGPLDLCGAVRAKTRNVSKDRSLDRNCSESLYFSAPKYCWQLSFSSFLSFPFLGLLWRDVNNLAVAVQTEEVLIASEKAMCEPSLT